MTDRDATAAAPARPGRVAGHRTIDIDRLDRPGRAHLGHEVFAIHRAVFAGLDEAGFVDHVLHQPARRNLIRLFLDRKGTTVGYCAVHLFARTLRGRPCTVIRAEAGLLADYRGRGSTYWFGMVQALRQKVRHPLTPLYYLGTLVHPSSYHLFCKYFTRVYPAADTPMPAPVRALAVDLIESFDSPAVDPADPLVRDVHWITVETAQEAALTRARDLPDVRYFLRRNPGYARGHGMVVMVPLTLPNILGALARRLAERLREALTPEPPPL